MSSEELESYGKAVFRESARMDIPGMPARLQDMVNMSERYMVRGSSVFSPNLKAAVGEVGVSITSHF